MPSLAEIRARIAQQENKSQQSSSGPSDNSIYPHWNMPEGTTASMRFLPDGDPKNEFFWVERALIKLPFNGVKGQPEMKKVDVQVPCMEMYGEACPVLAEVRPWYKDESLKDMANKYWKKRSYIFQGFVRQNPLTEDKAPANPIRKFIISPQLIPIIRSGLMDPEILEIPTHYERGLDFNIKKSTKGGYADYGTSNWARRETALTEAEREAIETHGLFKLADFLPKKPTEAELRIIKEMFDASVNGEAYDPARWGTYYRPYGVNAPNNASNNASTTSNEPAKKEVEATTSAPWEAEEEPAPVRQPVKAASTSSDKAADILAMIKARQNKAA
jgi:hypothetical protein